MVVTHIATVGCYQPALRDCTVRCESPDSCATGQSCVADWCVGPGVASCDDDGTPVMVDASMVVSPDGGADTPLSPDARDICSQGCTNGSCIDGVCTIDCSAPGSCPNDVVCPFNLPCHVICGDGACGHKVNCTGALDCQIDCVGESSCLDEIQCSPHRCEVTCSGQNACKRRTKCANACGCDVTCSGAGSCEEASECPASVCRVGNGCTSQPIGCDECP